ncbi:MAG: prepilin peptidase [Desulfobacterium sp.]|nr:prepilin peptidase [Desulfobacterium sp.]MBU3947289.1 A24 family peptidase [Pseudomonadota bacterium]MBU4036744.1 A24 family peptidase [Pseudomonadota bacterium]
MNDGQSILIYILIIVLIIAAVWDLFFHKIPNWLTFPAAAVSVIYHTGLNGWSAFFFSLEGICLGVAILLPFYLLGGMGAGDVKLLGTVGGFVGPLGVLFAFLFTALAGGIYAIIVLAVNGCLKESTLRFKTILTTFLLTGKFIYIPPPAKEQKLRLLYGIPIAVGTLLAMGFGNSIL